MGGALRVFQGSYGVISKKFKGYFKDVSRVFIKEVSRVFQERLQSALMVFDGCFKSISKNFLGSYRCFK